MYKHLTKLILAGVVAALCAVIGTPAAFAQEVSGCLTTGGKLKNFVLGGGPVVCPGTQTPVTFGAQGPAGAGVSDSPPSPRGGGMPTNGIIFKCERMCPHEDGLEQPLDGELQVGKPGRVEAPRRVWHWPLGKRRFKPVKNPCRRSRFIRFAPRVVEDAFPWCARSAASAVRPALPRSPSRRAHRRAEPRLRVRPRPRCRRA